MAILSPTRPPSSGSSSTATIAYVNDIKPILDGDCVACHGSRIHENNVRLDTYANVMRVVTPGNANSLLVRETRPGAVMYANLTGDRAAKADLIRLGSSITMRPRPDNQIPGWNTS